MAASSITFCANWRRKAMALRSLLLVAPALALAACAPSGSDEEKGSGVSFGFELASAKDAVPNVASPVINLTVEDLRERLASGDVRLIDVRTAEEVAEGTIPGAEHIALDDFDPAQLDLSDGREVILYCRSGRRSGIAAERLAQYTGEPAKQLAGGIIAWREAGYPNSGNP
jgi:rhodanese-related sulfurtransferase